MGNIQYFFKYETAIPDNAGYSFFDSTHLIWMFVSFSIVGLLVFMYKRVPENKKKRFMRVVAALLILCEVVRNGWIIAVGEYTLDKSLPLQLSRIMVFIEAGAIFFDSRYLREFTYACGLFSVAAFIAPDIMQYPMIHINTIRYTVAHVLILAVPLMWISGEGFRPDIRYLPKCALLLLGIAAVAETANVVLGSNYLHIHRIPEHVNINLGQPWFAIAFLGVILGFWLLVYTPWVIINRTGGKS